MGGLQIERILLELDAVMIKLQIDQNYVKIKYLFTR